MATPAIWALKGASLYSWRSLCCCLAYSEILGLVPGRAVFGLKIQLYVYININDEFIFEDVPTYEFEWEFVVKFVELFVPRAIERKLEIL